jgi:hypothetical protein
MTVNELEVFYEEHPDGRFYKAFLAEYPIKAQLKIAAVLKVRSDKSTDVDTRRRQTETLKLKFRRRQRKQYRAALERHEQRRREQFNETLKALCG